ncbi:MAG: hypothetical protein U0L85_03915 [Bacilli bacterium]|nr:hypothetical protein [Bacilli bacterium]
MANVHFNMIVEMNQLLKENNIEYTIHMIGGCSQCGVFLARTGKECSIDKILEVINQYLSVHWLKAVQREDSLDLDIVSKFDIS